MLPNYQRTREKILDFYFLFLEFQKNKLLGPLNSIKKYKVFEGRTLELKRESGEVDKTKIETFKSIITIKKDEYESITFSEILKRLSEVAEDMHKQYMKFFFDTIDEAVTKVGNVVDLKGKAITPEDVYKLFEKMQIDFDEKLIPKNKTLIANELGQKQFIEVMEKIESDPELRNKFDKLFEKKKIEYLDRENNRELVG